MEVLVVTEDEGLVPLFIHARNVQRAAGCSANLVAAKLAEVDAGVDGAHASAWSLEVVEGIEGVTGIKLVCRTVEVVRPRLGDHVDHVARAPSILSRKRVVLDFEFLNRVHAGDKDDRAPLRVGIP